MWGSAIFYTGAVVAALGLVMIIRPTRTLRVRTRHQALVIAVTGAIVATLALRLPARESRATVVVTRLDEFVPRWQFREHHAIAVAASPERTFEALKRVRADEIWLFNTLTWIRRGGRQAPQSILNAGDREPLIDIATKSGFIRLAENAPRELVIGTVVVAPPGTRGTLTPEFFQNPAPPGFAIAAMNFLVSSEAGGRSRVSTETRVFASDASSRRRFAAYWRTIYPGSVIIRRMWLRAIKAKSEVRTSNLPR